MPRLEILYQTCALGERARLLTASGALEGLENKGKTPTEEEWSFAFSSGVLCDGSNGLSVKQELEGVYESRRSQSGEANNRVARPIYALSHTIRCLTPTRWVTKDAQTPYIPRSWDFYRDLSIAVAWAYHIGIRRSFNPCLFTSDG